MTFATKCYIGSIKVADTRADRLTMEKLGNLVNWAEYHPTSYFEQFPIQFALDMYHVCAAWDSMNGLFEEADDDEIAAVVRAYNKGLRTICGLRGAEYSCHKFDFTPSRQAA